jgi:multiple sugar transport system substrate-binding protein
MAKKLTRLARSAIGVPLLAAALIAAGCSSGSGEAPGEEDASGALTVWVGSWWEPIVPGIVQDFEAANPGIDLTIEPLPVNGYLDKFTSSALGGNPPDVIDLDSTWLATVAAQGLLEPLDEHFSDIKEADYAPGIWAASHFQGAMYALPARGESEVWYYNKTVFDKAGVPYPTDGWTHDDLVRVAQELTIPGEQWGIGVPADASDPSNVLSLFAPILWYFGGDFLNADNTAAEINSPASVKAIQYWSDFYLKYGASPEGTPNFSTTRDLAPLFQANKLGLIVSSSNTFDTLSQTKGLQWGTVLAPDKINRSGGWTMGIPTGAENPAAARAFLRWFADPQNQASHMNRFPSRIDARELPPWNDAKYDIFRAASPDSRSVPSVAGWFQMQTAAISELQQVLVRQKTPQQAADAAADAINKVIAENH